MISELTSFQQFGATATLSAGYHSATEVAALGVNQSRRIEKQDGVPKPPSRRSAAARCGSGPPALGQRAGSKVDGGEAAWEMLRLLIHQSCQKHSLDLWPRDKEQVLCFAGNGD